MLSYQGKWLSVENTKGSDTEKNAELLLKGHIALLEGREKRKRVWGEVRRVSEFRIPSPLYWRRQWQPTPVFLPGEPQGRQSLVGCRLQGCTVGHD